MKYKRLPKGFREDRRTGEVACPHRDVSCCPECAGADFLVEIYAQHFFAPEGRQERIAAMRAELEAEGSTLDEEAVR